MRRHASESIWVIGPMRLRAAGAVHRAVQSAAPRGGCLDRARDLVLVGDVGRLIANSAAASSGRRFDVGDRGGEPVRVAADDHHSRAGADERGGHALTDAAAAACYQIRPVSQRQLHLKPLRLASRGAYVTGHVAPYALHFDIPSQPDECLQTSSSFHRLCDTGTAQGQEA